MIANVLQLILIVLVLAAWRFGVLWFSPFREDGRRRLGAGRVSRMRATAHAAIAERFGIGG